MVERTRPARARQTLESGTQGAPGRCPRCAGATGVEDNFCARCGYSLVSTDPGRDWHDPLIGALIDGRYRLVKKLGSGGMGSVYEVEHVHMGKLMAIKLLHGDLSRDETMVRRFSREARAISRLASRHTVQCFDFGQANGLVYIVMELLRGRDLGALLHDYGALPPDEVVGMVEQIADAVGEAHAKNIIHRDIKPENIFVCAASDLEDEHVKVLDFGLAKLRERAESMIHTQEDSVLGTPHYMSPEQIEGRDVGPPSDVYALGAVIYKLLTGSPPFPGRGAVQVLYRHVHDPIPQISAHDAALTPLDDFFMCALAKRPGERFQSVEALSRAFVYTVSELPQATRARARRVQLDSEVALAIADTLHEEPASQRRLVTSLRSLEVDNLTTRAEFDRYELRLKLRRGGAVLFSVLGLAGIGVALYWGLVLGHFIDHTLEGEPNDTLDQADALRAGEAVSGALGRPAPGAPGDRDIYRIAGARPGQVVRLHVTALPGVDLVLELVTGRGERLLFQNANPVGVAETVPNLTAPDEALFVIVREFWREGEKGLALPDVFYHLRLDARDAYPGEEREPNDALAQATAARLDETVTGYIGHVEDRDHFLITPPADASPGVALIASLDGVARLDLALERLDEAGEVVEVADARGLSGAEQLRLGPLEGAEAWRVRVVSRRGHDPDQPYTLSFDGVLTVAPQPEGGEEAPGVPGAPAIGDGDEQGAP